MILIMFLFKCFDLEEFFYRELKENTVCLKQETAQHHLTKRGTFWDSVFDFMGFSSSSSSREPRKISDNDIREAKCKYVTKSIKQLTLQLCRKKIWQADYIFCQLFVFVTRNIV